MLIDIVGNYQTIFAFNNVPAWFAKCANNKKEENILLLFHFSTNLSLLLIGDVMDALYSGMATKNNKNKKYKKIS
jgi:hypothetical protein